MLEVSISELRAQLFGYLASVEKGVEISVTSRGRIIARIMPPDNEKKEALKQLKKLRKQCEIGDIILPINENWKSNK